MARHRKSRHRRSGRGGKGFRLPLIGKLTLGKLGVGIAAWWFLVRPAMASAPESEAIPSNFVSIEPVGPSVQSEPITPSM
jgi:hypothetical protein